MAKLPEKFRKLPPRTLSDLKGLAADRKWKPEELELWTKYLVPVRTRLGTTSLWNTRMLWSLVQTPCR